MSDVIKRVNLVIDELYEQSTLKAALLKHAISSGDFYKTVHQYPELLGAYERAQQARAELMVEDIPDIADNEDDAQKARNKIDARKWYASKMKPHKFGDRIDLNVNGTLDIKTPLNEARKRLESRDVIDVGPIDDLASRAEPETLVIPQPQSIPSTDSKSVSETEPLAADQTPSKEDVDKFFS